MPQSRLDQYRDLLERAFDHVAEGTEGLSAEQIQMVVFDLQHTTVDREKRMLLNILGYIEDPSYKDIVASFLNGPDPVVVSEALWVLCDCWDLTDQYIGQLVTLMEGASWDSYDYARLWAVGIAEQYLMDHAEPQLLRQLISMAEDENISQEGHDLAYGALRSVLRHPPDAVLLQQAKDRLRRELMEREYK